MSHITNGRFIIVIASTGELFQTCEVTKVSKTQVGIVKKKRDATDKRNLWHITCCSEGAVPVSVGL